MKKMIGLLVAALVASSVAMANEVLWFIPAGVFDGGDTGILEQQDTSVLWQLIYAGPCTVDGSGNITKYAAIDPIDIANTTGGYVSGDDVVIGSRKLYNGNSGVFDEYLMAEDDMDTGINLPYVYKASDPYFVYQRIFDDADPVAGVTKYYDSGLTLLNETEYGDGQQSVPLSVTGTGGANGATVVDWDNGVTPNTVVPGAQPSVPEPATMSLLGLGALAMVLRRKLRK